MTGLWLRQEVRATERRAPISPADAAGLVRRGIELTVEQAPHRCFPIEEYAAAGCRIAEAGSWPDADPDQVVIGLKELPAEPAKLRHRHIYFGHAYKQQPGAERLLRRFVTGGGELLDLEYLTEASGRRLAAFGYWAGYLGAALAVLQFRGELDRPLRSGTRAELDARLRAGSGGADALVIGALGRSGRGACDALRVAGLEPTRWDQAETARLDRDALRAHEILINTVLVTGPTTPFVTRQDLTAEHRLRVICDVTCDAGSPFNVLPIYTDTTTWAEPVATLAGGVELIAIDNLPALLPIEASTDFSADLTPHLADLTPHLADLTSADWQRCRAAFRQAVHRHRLDEESLDA